MDGRAGVGGGVVRGPRKVHEERGEVHHHVAHLRLYPSFQPLVTTASPHAEKTTHMASCWATSLVQNVDDAADHAGDARARLVLVRHGPSQPRVRIRERQGEPSDRLQQTVGCHVALFGRGPLLSVRVHVHRDEFGVHLRAVVAETGERQPWRERWTSPWVDPRAPGRACRALP